MLPGKRLATLLQDLKDRQIAECIYHNTSISPTLYSGHACNGVDFPRTQNAVLTLHASEVWSLAFSHDGSCLATAGADGKILLWNTGSYKLDGRFGDHFGGISFLSWSPDDRRLVSCDQTGRAKVWNLMVSPTSIFIAHRCQLTISAIRPGTVKSPLILSIPRILPNQSQAVLGHLTVKVLSLGASRRELGDTTSMGRYCMNGTGDESMAATYRPTVA